jgi:beta-lactam-binding protein with PASTA domain
MQEAQATSVLQQAGFSVKIVSAPEPNGQPRGTVFKQSPPGGTVAARGSVITIYA